MERSNLQNDLHRAIRDNMHTIANKIQEAYNTVQIVTELYDKDRGDFKDILKMTIEERDIAIKAIKELREQLAKIGVYSCSR